MTFHWLKTTTVIPSLLASVSMRAFRLARLMATLRARGYRPDCFFFFFSSRRRHTRFDCDWSSDVCSSDLAGEALADKDDGRQPVPVTKFAGRIDDKAVHIRAVRILEFRPQRDVQTEWPQVDRKSVV